MKGIPVEVHQAKDQLDQLIVLVRRKSREADYRNNMELGALLMRCAKDIEQAKDILLRWTA